MTIRSMRPKNGQGVGKAAPIQYRTLCGRIRVLISIGVVHELKQQDSRELTMIVTTLSIGLTHVLAGVVLTVGTFIAIEQDRKLAVPVAVSLLLLILLADSMAIAASWMTLQEAALGGSLGWLMGVGATALLIEPEPTQAKTGGVTDRLP